MSRLLGNGAVVSVGRSGVCALSWPGSASDAKAAAAIAKRLKRMENITIRLAPGCVRIVLDAQPTRAASKRVDNAAFGGRPQGYGRRIDWRAPGSSPFQPAAPESA